MLCAFDGKAFSLRLFCKKPARNSWKPFKSQPIVRAKADYPWMLSDFKRAPKSSSTLLDSAELVNVSESDPKEQCLD